MSADHVSVSEFAELLRRGTRLIDVRAPVEFADGAIPGAVNLPLLNDEERAAVGTAYKKEGQEAAIALGHRLISGATKEARVGAWLEELKRSPDAVFYCFRGGLRSRISRQWAEEAGVRRPLVDGGFKELRRFLRAEVERLAAHSFLVIAGPTGSGKTDFLREAGGKIIDLEKCARHRGSAFGAMPGGQPCQVDFENAVALEALKLRLSEGETVLVEDESRMIGQRIVPAEIFDKIRTAPVLLLEEPLEARVERILRDYVAEPLNSRPAADVYAEFEGAISSIERKLGGLRATEIRADLAESRREFLERGEFGRNRDWIAKLLNWYYDPLYRRGLERNSRKILARGSRKDLLSRVRIGH